MNFMNDKFSLKLRPGFRRALGSLLLAGSLLLPCPLYPAVRAQNDFPPAKSETADELAALQQEQELLSQQLEKAQKELSAFQSQKDLKDSNLSWLLERDAEQRAKYKAQLMQVAGITKIKKSLDKSLEVAIRKYDERKTRYGQRIEAMYRMQKKSPLEIYLESDNLEAYSSTMLFMKMISDADEQDLIKLREAREDLSQRRKETEENLKDYSQLLEALEKDLKAIEEDIEDYQSNVDALDEEMQSRLEAINQFTQQDDELQMGIDAMQAQLDEEERQRKLAEERASLAGESQEADAGTASPKYTGGAFTWPCPSYSGITSGFGYRSVPEAGLNDFHTGLDMAANYDDQALAATSGVVVYASWMEYGGNTVKIDIGGGTIIMYCHLNSIAVSVGQTVSPGEVVGYVGTTGLSTGPHLHFEVQQDGTPVDPWLYLS